MAEYLLLNLFKSGVPVAAFYVQFWWDRKGKSSTAFCCDEVVKWKIPIVGHQDMSFEGTRTEGTGWRIQVEHQNPSRSCTKGTGLRIQAEH